MVDNYLMCSVPVVENSLLNDSKFSRPQLFTDLDGLRADDVLPRDLDAAVVLDMVR